MGRAPAKGDRCVGQGRSWLVTVDPWRLGHTGKLIVAVLPGVGCCDFLKQRGVDRVSILWQSVDLDRPGKAQITALEDIATSFGGVQQAYAIQAGREVRIIVKPDAVDDMTAIELSRGIAQKVEDSLQYPGQIKITVIRETRAIEFAK